MKTTDMTANGATGGRPPVAEEGFDIATLPHARTLLREIPKAARILLTGCAVQLLAKHPNAGRHDINRIANLLWHEARALEYDAEGHTIDQALSVPGIAAPTMALRDLVAALLEGYAVECTLVEEADRIAKALEAYRGLRG